MFVYITEHIVGIFYSVLRAYYQVYFYIIFYHTFALLYN